LKVIGDRDHACAVVSSYRSRGCQNPLEVEDPLDFRVRIGEDGVWCMTMMALDDYIQHVRYLLPNSRRKRRKLMCRAVYGLVLK
jgi:hypothetical protein